MENGMIHVYYGTGKGKTSILNGMVIRALGAGLTVKYVRFLKNRPTSENAILKKLGVEIDNFYKFSTKFVWEMNDDEKQKFKAETLIGFEQFKKYLGDSTNDIIFADEILGAVENGFIGENELITALINRKSNIEVILSGRKIFDKLAKISNLISNIDNIKHYLNEGISSRFGIEF